MNLRELVEQYGKEKVNTLTKYPSILTLHRLGDKGRLTREFTTPLAGETLFASEKLDGTSVRLVCLGSDYLVGSREFLLHHSGELFHDPAQGIVDGIRSLDVPAKLGGPFPRLTVIYGELYGGKVSANSKCYGTGGLGYRVFDVAEYADLSILDCGREEISRWRETETPEGIVYGQAFLSTEVIRARFPDLEMVPSLPFELGDASLETVYASLKCHLPETLAALTPNATRRPEGVVLRNAARTKIVKLRFEDYERTFK